MSATAATSGADADASPPQATDPSATAIPKLRLHTGDDCMYPRWKPLEVDPGLSVAQATEQLAALHGQAALSAEMTLHVATPKFYPEHALDAVQQKPLPREVTVKDAGLADGAHIVFRLPPTPQPKRK